ncbi:DUF4432 family protein [Jiangella muralis]|uniref:DUF4432 family protein n=1 Tax=Jiangella muralis TaxID=702383 RepID=UPI00069F9DC1|nr:DUF4432 family protein [Jiangella muralis]
MSRSADPVRLPLAPRLFRKTPAEVLSTGPFLVTAFRYASGVAALRIAHDVGDIVVLPFQGQQIWDARFHGRRLTMRSTFTEPVRTTEYMRNNGAYLIHCGGSAMGRPGPADVHAPHGELPNARHRDVVLVVTPGDPLTLRIEGGFVSATGFGPYFGVRTSVTMTAGSALLDSRVEITNLSGEPRPLMYLAHLNFRPAIGGRIDDHPATPPAEAGPASVVDVLDPDVRVEPELVRILPGSTRGAPIRTAQVHRDGSADIVEHDSPDLTHLLRWLRRTADDQAYGFALPATAGPDGFTAEDARGNVRRYPPGGRLVAVFRHGMVTDWARHRAAPPVLVEIDVPAVRSLTPAMTAP